MLPQQERLSARKLNLLAEFMLWPWAVRPLNLSVFLPTHAQGLKVSVYLHKAQGHLTSPLPDLLPFCPCSLLKLASSLYLQQVQPAPTSGPLHMTASLPGLIGVSLESPTFPPSLPSGSVQMSLIKEAAPDHPISNNIPSPNHTPYMPDFALFLP